MKTYEINYLLPIELDNEKAQEIALKLESLVQENGGILIGERKTKKIKLGYEIKDSEQVIQACFRFKIDQSQLQTLHQELKKTQEILRYIVLCEKEAKIIKPFKAKDIKSLLIKKPVSKISSDEIDARVEDAIKGVAESVSEENIDAENISPSKEKLDDILKPEKKKKVGLKRIEEKLNEILNI